WSRIPSRSLTSPGRIALRPDGQAGSPDTASRERTHASLGRSTYGPPGGSTVHTFIISGTVSAYAVYGQVPHRETTPNPGGSSVTQTLCACHRVSDPPGAGPGVPAVGIWYTTPSSRYRPPAKAYTSISGAEGSRTRPSRWCALFSKCTCSPASRAVG